MFVAILADFKIKFTVLSKLVAFVFRPEPVIDFLYHNTLYINITWINIAVSLQGFPVRM